LTTTTPIPMPDPARGSAMNSRVRRPAWISAQ
jgi:hypothetical protein